MANEMKACCGGFLVGEGLEMDGKVLKASGSAGGCNFYNIEINGEVPSWAGGGSISYLRFSAVTDATFTNKEQFLSYLEDEGYNYMITTCMGGGYNDDSDEYNMIFNACFKNVGDSGMCVVLNCIQESDGSAHEYFIPLYPDTIEIDITAKP